MTVRAWFTISALVLAALAAAFALQILRPVQPPEVVVRTDDRRLVSYDRDACWPQRNGKLRCTSEEETDAERNTIDENGSLRIVLASPAQPKDGSIRVTNLEDETVLKSGWKRTLRYDLDPGDYTLTAHAGESGKGKAYVRYAFLLRVTRSGS
jgi:hypothetical protein